MTVRLGGVYWLVGTRKCRGGNGTHRFYGIIREGGTYARSAVMAKKTAVDKIVVNVSELSVTGEFSVSSKDRPTKQGPFVLIVKYTNVDEALRAAFSTTRIMVQSPYRALHAADKPLGLKEGEVIRCNGKGERIISEAERNALAMTRVLADPSVLKNAPLAQKIQAAELMGLPVPKAWRDELAGATKEGEPSEEAVDEDEDEEEESSGLRYKIDDLMKLGTQKLRQLAQDEEIEDYSKMNKEELVEALGEIEE